MPDDRLRGAAPEFSLRSQLRGRSLEVALSGELDMAAAFRLEPAVEQLLDEDAVHALVLDLADIVFVDSAGLGAILAIRDRSRAAGIAVAIARPSDPIRRLLGMTGNADVLNA
jgi:anti-sigma B factor antagonist